MAVEFLDVPPPGPTAAERARRDFGAGVAWLGFGGFMYLVVPLVLGGLAGSPSATPGASHVAFWYGVFLPPFLGFMGYQAWSAWGEYWEFQPVDELESRWLRLLIKVKLATAEDATKVRFIGGGERDHTVLVRPLGVDAEAFEAKAGALASAMDVPAVEVMRRPGGWLHLRLLPVLPQPVPDAPEGPDTTATTYSGEQYEVPEASTWRGYFSRLPVGVLHGHTSGAYRWPIRGSSWADVQHIKPEDRLPQGWGLPLLGSHVLLGGETGAGKSSWTQSITDALLPAVAHGAAVLVGIDPKGVELAIGRGFFTHYASEPDAITELLEFVVDRMNERKQRMAGKTRLVRPTSKEPLWVVLIDELAPLTKLDPDTKRRARTVAAMNILLTQGRALGFSLVGAVQDPRKETVDSRDLFNIRVALKMPSGSVDVVLGPKCREEGAAAHKLTEEWRGAGYVYDGKGYALVRAYWHTDEQIIAEASEFQDGEFVGSDWDQWWCPIDEPRHPASRRARTAESMAESMAAAGITITPASPERVEAYRNGFKLPPVNQVD